MNMSNEEVILPDGLEEVELPPSPTKDPKLIESIWDDDKLEKFVDADGDNAWRCLWCHLPFKHPNATKALYHVNKVKRNDIARCKSNAIDASHKETYARLLEKKTARKDAQTKAKESKKRSSDEYLNTAGEAYAMTRKKKPSPFASSATTTPDGTPANQIQMQLNFGSNERKDNKETPRYYQQKLTDVVDPQAEAQLTMAIADLIHSCGLPFSLASHHKFHRVLSLSKLVSKKYTPPGRNKVGGELLDLNYDIYIKNTLELLLKEADVYGITFFGDAATVKKSPLINILASSVHLAVGCLRIVDCSGHLERDGRKDAAYISELFVPHILQMEQNSAKCTDLVIFDGASNVQKAGALLEARFPHITVLHGAEHVISLFYNDIFRLREFHILKNLNRAIYRYFGSGSMHSPFAIFSKHSRDHNGGKCIGLIRAADTRMGGHVISMLRTLRLKDPLMSTISSASFLQGKFQIDKQFLDILKKDTTWEFMAQFVRAVFPMLIVLRLADQQDPVMDKLFFYIRRMDQTLEKSSVILDELEQRMKGMALHVFNSLSTNDNFESESELVNEEMEDDDSTDSDTIDNTVTKTLGQKVHVLWQKRRQKLVSDFAIAGWLLSPIQEIYDDSSSNMTGEHRDAVDRLLKKVMGSDYADDSDELANVMNTFWQEFEEFKTKAGTFQKPYIWSQQNRDLLLGKSHFWHKKNSYFQTKILGRFACRICSKIVGMGSAERNWGDVKYLKSEKRSHLSAEAVEKQATIFGASCMADARIEREKVQSSTTERYKFWDEEDFDSEFDMLIPSTGTLPKKRVLKCYFEDWEEEHLTKKNDVSKAKFLQKYGGLEFRDIDFGTHYTICNKDMQYRRKTKKDRGGWTAIAYTQKKEKSTWVIGKGCPLHDCIATFYQRHPEKNYRVVIRKEQIDEIEWLLAQPEKQASDESDSDDDSQSSSSESTGSQSNDRNDRKPKAAKSKFVTASVDPISKANGNTTIGRNDPNSLSPCGGCGMPVGSVHKCDRCSRNMHPFCGRTIGDEGYGSIVRCRDCDL